MKTFVDVTTGKSLDWWFKTIQRLITKHSKPSKDHPGHDETNSRRVFRDLVGLLDNHLKPYGEWDENMRFCATIGLVCLYWFVNVQLGKILDPNRPIRLRTEALDRLIKISREVAQVNSGFSTLKTAPSLFSQEYRLPHDVNSKSGDYV